MYRAIARSQTCEQVGPVFALFFFNAFSGRYAPRRVVLSLAGWSLVWSGLRKPNIVFCFLFLFFSSRFFPRHVHHPNHHQSTSKSAAVLVLLYERGGGGGGLRVLLTTRSKELRSHPGQTALPGGKVDEGDAGIVEAAVSLCLLSPTRPPPPLFFLVSPQSPCVLACLFRFFCACLCGCGLYIVQGSKRGSRAAVALSARPHALHARAISLAARCGRDARGRVLG